MSAGATTAKPAVSRKVRLGRWLRPLGIGMLVCAWCISAAWSVQMIAAGLIGSGAAMGLALLRIAVQALVWRCGWQVRLWKPVVFLADLVTLVGAVLLIAWAAVVASGGGIAVVWAALAAAGVLGLVRVITHMRTVGGGVPRHG